MKYPEPLPSITIFKKLNKNRYILSNLPVPVLTTLSLIIIVLISYIQIKIGHIIDVSLFFLIPLIIITWSRPLGFSVFLTVSILAAWLYAEKILNKPGLGSIFINSGIRLTIMAFLIFIIEMFKNLTEELLLKSKHDGLTGLLNIRTFMEEVEEELDRMRRMGSHFSLAYIDIDNFKSVNDTLGHIEGNRLLKILASLLVEHTRSIDKVARFGGDEFVILLTNTTSDQADVFARHILKLLNGISQENHWPISFSIGIAVVKHPRISIDDVIRFSDKLMYDVKKSGKNGIKIEDFEA